MQFVRHCLAAAVLIAAGSFVWADDANKDGLKPLAIAEVKRDTPVDFQKEVLPILQKNCVACHNATTAENKLRLETPQLIAKGGDNGAGVAPKNAAGSLLFKSAAHLAEPIMPPEGNDVKAKNLTPEELGLIKLWIEQGATGEVVVKNIPSKWQPLPASVNPIYAVAISPDGQYAAAGRANQIAVYHVSSGKLMAQLADPAVAQSAGSPLAAHLDLVQSLAFNPAGDLVASGAFREVKLWRRPASVRKLEFATGEAARSITVSADGKWLAIGDTKGDIKLIDVAAGKEHKSLTGHGGAVTGLRFSADATKLYSGSLDKSIRTWNVADGAAAGQVDTPAPVNAITLTTATVPDVPVQIVSAEADNVARVWAPPALPAPEKPAVAIKELKGHTGAVNAIDTLPGGKEVLTGSADGNAKIFNIENASSPKQFSLGAPINSVAMRADGMRVVLAGASGAKLFDAANGQPVGGGLKGDYRTRLGSARADRAVAMTKAKIADGQKNLKEAEDRAKKEAEAVPKATEAKTAADKMLADKTEAAKKPNEAKATADKALADADAAAKAAATKATEAKAAADKDAANKDLAKAAEDAKKAAADADQKLAQAKTAATNAAKPTEQAAQEVKNAETAVQAAVRGIDAAQASAKRAAEAVPQIKSANDALDAALKNSETAAADAKKAATDSEQPWQSAGFSPDGLQLVTVGDNGVVLTWNSETGAPVDAFDGHGAALTAASFVNNGLLASGAANKTVIVWDLAPAWKLERTIGNIDDPTKLIDRVLGLEFSPDGKTLATGSGEPSRSGELKIWNVADGALVKNIVDAHSDTIFAVRFSPEGDFLASSGADRFVKTWNVAEGKLVKSFEGHTHHVLGVAWKSDGKQLASSGADNAIKVWDFVTGDQKKSMDGAGKEVTSISFVGDTDRTLSSSGDKTLKVHNSVSGGAEKTLSGGNDFMYSAAISPDGKIAIGGGQDSVLRVWNVENGQPMRTFEPAKPDAALPK